MDDISKIREGTKTLRRLNHIRRFSSYPVIRPENVSEHTFWVQMYSIQIARDLQSRGKQVDISKVLMNSFVHDFEESMTGDVVRTFKYNNPDMIKEVKKTEEKLAKELFLEKVFPEGSSFYSAWQNSKDQTIEGRIVAFADFYAVFEYCYEEIFLGNRHMIKVFDEAMVNLDEKKFELFIPWINEVKKMRKEISEL